MQCIKLPPCACPTSHQQCQPRGLFHSDDVNVFILWVKVNFRITTLQLRQNALALFLQRVLLFTIICTFPQNKRVNNAQQRILRELLLWNFQRPARLGDFGNVNATRVGLQISEIKQITISEVR